LPFHKFSQKTGKQGRNKGNTELYCLFISGVLFCDAKNELSPNPDLAPGGFEIVKSDTAVVPVRVVIGIAFFSE